MAPHADAPEIKSGENGAVNTKASLPGPHTPAPKVPDIDKNAYTSEDALVKDIIEGMKVAGGCIVRHLVDPAALDKVDGDIFPMLEEAKPWNGEYSLVILSVS